ncbi:MAG: TylF/MycF/NovP-related O-methyltransferase [Candidatus Paceibacterota bacterium]
MKQNHALERTLKLRMLPKGLFLKDRQKLALLPALKRAIPYTQLRVAPLFEMHDLIRRVNKENVPGAVVEMGCGRGGCGAFMAHSVEKLGEARDVWLFDSFEGLSEPREEDIKNTPKPLERVKRGYLEVGKEVAEEAVRVMELTHPERVYIKEGWFEDSVPRVKEQIGPIATLRLDADLYEPTKYCLETFWDQISEGGVVVIDDYKNWIGARRALYEFFCEKNIAPYLEHYPYGGKVYFQKNKNI